MYFLVVGATVYMYLFLCVDLCLSLNEHSHNINMSIKWCHHECSLAILCGYLQISMWAVSNLLHIQWDLNLQTLLGPIQSVRLEIEIYNYNRQISQKSIHIICNSCCLQLYVHSKLYTCMNMDMYIHAHHGLFRSTHTCMYAWRHSV